MNQDHQQHRATPDQWHNLYQHLKLNRVPDHISITLELASRIEALELALRIQSGNLAPSEQAELGVVPVSSLRAAIDRAATEALTSAMGKLRTTDEAQSTGLLETLVDAITNSAAAHGTADELAREVIRAFAAWLRTGRMLNAAELLELNAAELLEQEAERRRTARGGGRPMTSPLSSSAQAVLDAYQQRALNSREWQDGKGPQLKLAAALYAAAHRLTNDRRQLAAIADELEGVDSRPPDSPYLFDTSTKEQKPPPRLT
jgi:hypothetical protein